MYGGSGLNATKVPKAVDVQKQQVEEVFLNLKSGTDLDEVTPRTFSRSHAFRDPTS